MGKKVSVKKLKMDKSALKKKVLKDRKKYFHKLPSYIYKQFEVDELLEGGRRCYRMIPKEGFSGTYIVYIYGSCMCKNISDEQWDFITKLSIKTGSGLFVPMYPLAPENCCREVFEMLQKAYANLTRGCDVEKVILLGDSSGAGLALSLSIVAWKEGLKKPDQLILLSPALDTEFFDKELETQVVDSVYKENRYFYSEGAKDFINSFWVKDYAVKTEYTSPFYEDYTDICGDVVVVSSLNDMFNCYARAFYQKAKLQGLNARFFEFEEECHNFMIHSKSKESKKAFDYLVDVINMTFDASVTDVYPLKLLSTWSKKYPELIRDDWASKFVYGHNFDFSKIRTKYSEYRNLVMATSLAACDKSVERYIMEYPNATIVNIGCRLDNMFERMDNGRIQWYSIDSHNTMSVRRAMYGERPREKTIGRTLMDLTWIDEISCDRNKGIIFVCHDELSFCRPHEVKNMLEKIWHKFPGAEFVFTTSTTGATAYMNMFRETTRTLKKRKMSINDATKVISEWRADYKILAEEPLSKYLPKTIKLKLFTKVAVNYNKISYNHKLIRVKLGSEAYDVAI